jgi:cysteinyl-tRNA synthetase
MAKKQKDWQLADEIRTELSDMEIEIEDKPDGTSVWKKR